MSSSEQQFGSYTSSTNEHPPRSDLESLTSIARSFLDHLRYNLPGMSNDTYFRIIQICIEQILASHQPRVVLNENTYNNVVVGDRLITRTLVASDDSNYQSLTDFPVALGHQHLQAELPGQKHSIPVQGSRNIMGAPGPPSGMNLPFGQGLPAFVGASGPISNDSGLPLYSSARQYVTYTESQAMPGPSASNSEEPNTLGGKERVRCGWPGCSSIIRKDGRTRHENETHWREFKDFCAHCGKGFLRKYLKSNHELTCHGASS